MGASSESSLILWKCCHEGPKIFRGWRDTEAVDSQFQLRLAPHSLACLRWKVFQREVVALSSSTVDNFSHGQLEGAVTPANERKLNAKSVTRSLQQP